MGLFWQRHRPLRANPRQASRRRVLRRRTGWLAVWFVGFCFVTAVQATDPYAAALDNLDNAVKARVQQMAQTAELAPPPPVTEGHLPLVFVIFLLVILGWRVVVQTLNRRQEAQGAAAPPGANPLERLYLDEPSLAAFFDQLQSGKPDPLLVTNFDAPLDQSSPLLKFFDAAPAELTQLQAVLLEVRRSNDPAAQKKKLLEIAGRLHALNYDYCRTELGQIWQLTATLEEMLRQLAGAKSGPAASALQTLSGALGLFKAVCDGRLTLPPDKEAPAKLLIMDHNSLSRSTLSAALKKAFNPPDLAPDVPATLAQIEKQTYDGIFLDLETPGLDAVELCAKIRASKLNAATPVVFITKQSDFEARAKTLVRDGQQLLGKPFLFTEATLAALAVVVRSRLERGMPRTETAVNEALPSQPPKPASLHKPVAAKAAADKPSPSTKPPKAKTVLTPAPV